MKKLLKPLIVVIYLIGICCVVFFAVGYLQFSDYVANPNAMLPIPDYEGDALMLLFGAPVMLASCVSVVLTFRGMKPYWKVAVFLPFAVCVVTVGHYFLIGAPSEPEDTRAFSVAVTLDTDEPIYVIGMDILLDGEVIGGQKACTDARAETPLTGTTTFSIIPYDVPEGRELCDLTLAFSLFNQPMEQGESDGFAIENGTVSCTDWEEIISMTVTGTGETGYRAAIR